MNNIVANTNFILHQINTVVGDIEGNTGRIIDSITTDNAVHIFPECAVTGYLCGNLYNRLDFVKEADKANSVILSALLEKTELRNIIVIFGNITFHGISKDNFPKLKNSAIVINKYTDEFNHYPKVVMLNPYHKQLLANSGHHEDRKYFKAGKETTVFNVILSGKSFKIGVPICEDAWFKDHKRNINLEMSKLGANILISINQSFFSYGKQVAKMKMVSEIAQQSNLPVIYLNNVGCGDVVKNIVTYNGGSMIFNDNGKLVKHLPIFEEVHDSFDFRNAKAIKGLNFDKYHEILMCLIYGTKEFAKLSHVANLQVHVSGGLDSAIVSYITAKAMGKSNTIFIHPFINQKENN
jgi:NAD+ synthase (glutamine-hydrolysing)